MNSNDKQPEVEKEVDCPLCNSTLHNKIIVGNEETGLVPWYLCQCGYMFNLVAVKREEVFNEEYLVECANRKGANDRILYYARLYFPLIEELTYGRRALDVGCANGVLVDELRRRGWLAAGIDLADTGHIKGDFEVYDFKGERFDLILMMDVVQSFFDVLAGLKKAVSLLRPNGILFIVTPNTDLMRRDIIARFGHFDMDVNRSFINEKILNDAMIKACPDFSARMNLIVGIPDNVSQRFLSWNNMHMMYQKRSIEYVDQQFDLRKDMKNDE